LTANILVTFTAQLVSGAY